jgi:hypothetical protein
MSACECDWKYHQGQPCPAEAHDHGPGVRTSPELCMQCLFVCCGEREDEEDDDD